jgi:peptidoglycan/LPS O-acetylase OafA/YrhL
VPTFLPSSFVNIEGARPFIAFFSLGALCATNKDIIDIQLPKALLLWLLVFGLKDTPAYQHLFYIALFYTMFYLTSLRFVIRRLRLPFDASYGVYIYGYMIQQCLFGKWPHLGVHGNQAVSIAIAIAMGILSWRFVEKPAIDLGHRVASKPFLLWFKRTRIPDRPRVPTEG